jgi:hypothetical protein
MQWRERVLLYTIDNLSSKFTVGKDDPSKNMNQVISIGNSEKNKTKKCIKTNQ